MHPYVLSEIQRARHADLVRDAEAHRIATAHRPRRTDRGLLRRRRTA
jgi:hypothetical protein